LGPFCFCIIRSQYAEKSGVAAVCRSLSSCPIGKNKLILAVLFYSQ